MYVYIFVDCMEYNLWYITLLWNVSYVYLCIYIYTHTYTWDIPVEKLRMEWDMGHMCVYIYMLCLKSNYVLLCMEYFLHLGNFDGTCRELFHTWSI